MIVGCHAGQSLPDHMILFHPRMLVGFQIAVSGTVRPISAGRMTVLVGVAPFTASIVRQYAKRWLALFLIFFFFYLPTMEAEFNLPSLGSMDAAPLVIERYVAPAF